MTEVDISNPDLLRTVDPIRKVVYDDAAMPQFNIGHLHEEQPPDLFAWAEKERGKKSTYEMIGQPLEGGEQWELDVKPLISSSKWLQVHGLQRNRLSMKQILAQIGFKHTENYVETLGKPVGSYYGLGLFQQFKRRDGQLYNITVGREKLKQIEESLLRASHLYKRRIEWLTAGSRRIFGVIQEHSVCFVLDVSTMSQTQFDLYRESLCEVIRDQVSQLAKFNMIKVQADMEMWHEQAMPVTEVTIKSAIEWVQNLDRMAESSRTGCTEGVLKAMEDDTLEAVYLFAEGDVFETSKELLRQKLTTAQHPLHTVSFNAAKTGTIKFLKEIAAQTSGRFHAFVVKSIYEEDADALPANAAPPGGDAARISVRLAQKAKGGIPAGAGVREDVFKVWCELEETRNNHAQIQTLLTEIPETVSETAVVDRPSQTNRQEQYMSSKEWLQRYGLEARKVTAFQALAACSFRHVDGVVDLKGKPLPNTQTSDAENVRKLVNAKYCNQFAHTKWKDGTLVHVHITAEQHKAFEKKMKTTLDAIQQRIDWLQQGSREVFGTILEEQVYILIDTSQSMRDKLNLVKEKLFQLMQEQLRHKSKFNLIKFDTKAQAWRDRAADVTEQNLLNAWNWVKDIGVGGSTNTLAAIRIALSDPHTHAIYILTDGRPDQSPQMFWTLLQNPRAILAQVQLQHPVPIHTIAFNCNDVEANKFLFQLSSDTGGRYHNFSTNGMVSDGPPPFESEDVSLLKKEVALGKKDLEKVSKLRARCVMLDWYHNTKHKNTKFDVSSFSSSCNSVVSLTPNTRREKKTKSRYALTQRPHSAMARTRRESESDTETLPSRPHTSLGYSPAPPDTPPSSAAHKNHRGRSGVNDVEISQRQSRKRFQSTGQNQAGHTKTSFLRLSSQGHSELNGWMLPESKAFMESQILKSMEAYQDIVRLKADVKKNKQKKKRKLVNSLDIPNSVWLKKNGLVARKLTVMDVLTPTIVRVTPKYIPVLDTHVVSKVFNDVLPIAHVSPRSKKEIRLVNPAAVDLPGYDTRLQAVIVEYKTRLDLMVWRKLSQEEREKFENGPVSYLENTDSIRQAFDRMGWPLEEKDIQLLVDEIHLGERYLQQSTDLQNTAKKVAMGRRKKENKKRTSESSQDGVKSPTSDSGVSSSPQRVQFDSRKSSKKRRKFIDRLRGQSVIARDECDGFYYPGMVKHCTDMRHALVVFEDRPEAIVPTRFVISMSGAISCPQLRVGDYVLALNEASGNASCFVPGMVVGTPKRSQAHNKFFSILNYDNTKASLLRKNLVKISEVRYSFAMRYIEHANLTDHNVPAVNFVPAKQPEDSTSSSESDSDSSVSSKSTVSSTTTATSSVSSHPGVTRDDVNDLRVTLHDLQSRLTDHTDEQKKQRQILEKQSQDFEDVRKEFKKFAQDDKANRKPKVVVKVHESTNTEPVTPDTISTLTDVSPIRDDPVTPTEVLENPVTLQHRETQQTHEPQGPNGPQKPPPRTEVTIYDDGLAITSNEHGTGLHIARSPPEVIPHGSAAVRELAPKLNIGDEVLARSTDDGWYYRGTIHQAYADNSYDILDCTGLKQKTFREDLITEADDAQNIIEENDHLIALHPLFPNLYAPAIATKCRENNCYQTRCYDNSEAVVPREEVYKIHPHKYDLDVKFIVKQEKRWVGEAIVARSNVNGQYNLASCKKRIGNGHQYIVQWSDGSTSEQELSCIFGGHSRKRDIRPDDSVIAIADPINLVYLPGRVTSQNGNNLVVNFCNGIRSEQVNPDQSFWISRQYYDLAVAFYRSKQITD